MGKRQITPRPPAEGGIAGDTRIIPRSAIKRLSNVPRAQRFFEAFRMPKGFEDGGLAVVDFGFGLGDLTSGVPRVVARQVSSPVRIAAVTLPDTDLEQVAERWPQLTPILETVRASGEGEFDWGDFFLCWGDVRQHLYRLRGRADLILLEPPDVHQHPQFFSLEFLRRSLRMLQPGGVLVANSGSAALRGALIRLGATVGAVPGLSASQGTVASMDRNAIPEPLDERTTGIITKTLSGTPFRDRDLRWTRKQILQHRDEVLRRLRLRGWKKRLDAGDQEQESQ